jgi:hypothetical protein
MPIIGNLKKHIHNNLTKVGGSLDNVSQQLNKIIYKNLISSTNLKKKIRDL